MLRTRQQMMQRGVQGGNEGLNLKNGEEKSLAEKREQTGRRATRGSCRGQRHRQAVD